MSSNFFIFYFYNTHTLKINLQKYLNFKLCFKNKSKKIHLKIDV